MLRRAFLIAVALAALAALTPATSGRAWTFTDAAGRTVDIPDAPGRVLAAGPPAAVLIYALAPDKLVGWVRAPNEAEKEFLAAPYRDLPGLGRLTGKGGTANIEMILAQKPDLILDVGSVDPTYASLADRVQEQTGIPYVLIDGRFDRTPETLREAGRVLAVPEVGETAAAFAATALARLSADLTATPAEQRPRVYYGRGPDGLETGLAGSINTEVLAAAGALNVAEGAGAGGLAEVSLEQVLVWDPEVILAQDPEFARELRADPAWAGVAAVREGRVYVSPALPFGWFDAPPGINRIIGVDWLRYVLQGGSIDELRGRARDFYALFYHVDLSEAQLDQLLAGTAAAP